MTVVTVSPKYQVVIPKEVRDALGIKPGAKMTVVAQDRSLQMIPIRPIRELRGSSRGIDTTVEREADRL